MTTPEENTPQLEQLSQSPQLLQPSTPQTSTYL
jgi:hypothetical protein